MEQTVYNRPVLCFEAFHTRDSAMRNMGFEESPEEHPHFLDEGGRRIKVHKWISGSEQVFLYTIMIRVSTSEEWVDYLRFVRNLFPAVFVFNSELQQENIEPLGPKFKLNPSLDDLERVCGFVLSDEQRANHQRVLSRQDARPFNRDLFFHAFREASDFQARRQAAQMAARERLFQTIREHEGVDDQLELIFHPLLQEEEEPDDNDRFLRMALRFSEEEENRRREALEKARQKLQEGWEDVLKKSEPKKRGRPVCIVCMESEATICLVECSHQVMCDDCVREIWTRSTLAKACPLCKAECTMITRPIWSAVEEEEEEKEPTKKRKIK